MARLLGLACSAVVTLSGCSGASERSTTPASVTVSVPEAPVEPSQPEPSQPAEPSPSERASPPGALSVVDCREFVSAGALGSALVVAITPDCSSVGHLRILLEVTELVRGSDIMLIDLDRTIGVSDAADLEVDDSVIVAIDPGTRPAESVHCVDMPARQGSVRHFVKVDSHAATSAILAALAAGACAPKR